MSEVKHYEARVRVMIGDRRMNQFIRASGLGIQRLGVPHVFTLHYKEGEQVDEPRVLKLLADMQNEAERAHAEFEMTGGRVLSIELKDGPPPEGVVDPQPPTRPAVPSWEKGRRVRIGRD